MPSIPLVALDSGCTAQVAADSPVTQRRVMLEHGKATYGDRTVLVFQQRTELSL